MDVRRPDGSFLMIDDPIFAPIFNYLSVGGHTLLLHMAEPLACWQPLDERSPHYDYYRTHPQWHMYNQPAHPSHAELIAARDHVLERYPDLRVVGAHLASLEYDVDEVADRLQKYPNFAVDISARLGDLALQDSSKVRDFFIAYQDRILFGTDVVMREKPSLLAEAERAASIRDLRHTYEVHFAYLETTGPLTIRGIETHGLSLPQPILDKVYRENALRWYPAAQVPPLHKAQPCSEPGRQADNLNHAPFKYAIVCGPSGMTQMRASLPYSSDKACSVSSMLWQGVNRASEICLSVRPLLYTNTRAAS